MTGRFKTEKEFTLLVLLRNRNNKVTIIVGNTQKANNLIVFRRNLLQ